MIFDKEETKNLLNMLCSPDKENASLAFQAIENANLSNYFGQLIVMYKYSKIIQGTWEKEAPKAWKIISEHFEDKSEMTSGKCLSVMIDKKVDKEVIELYFEYFVLDMAGFLTQLGYPTEHISIDIKLKNE